MGHRHPLTCPSERALLVHVDGGAGPDLDEHLAACPRCRSRIDALRALDACVAAEEPLPPGLLERALAIPDRAPRSRWRAPAVVGMAAVLLLGLGLALRATISAAPTRPSPSVSLPPETSGGDPQLATVGARVERALARGGPDAATTLDALGDRALVALHRIARGEDAVLAGAALRRIATLARPASLPVLLDLLERPDRRALAAEALGRLRDERAVEPLARMLPEPAAKAALVAIGGKDAVHVLERRLREAGAEEGAALLDEIAALDGPAGTEAVLARLEDPVLGAAARAALHAHAAALTPHLLTLASEGESEDAVSALEALEVLAPDGVEPVVAELLARRDRRAAAARVLARIDSTAAHAALLGALPAPEVRAAFRVAGARLRDRLRATLSQAAPRERIRAIDLLGVAGDEAAVGDLEPLADDPALAPHVVTALGRIGGDAAVAALGRLATRPALERPAVEALGWTGTPAAVPVLERLADADGGLRAAVCRALARHASTRAVASLARLDASGARALRQMDASFVVPTLVAMLDGDDASAARRALRTLGRPVASSRAEAARLH